MAKAKVLYIHMTGASSEILKNLVLAGIRAVVCDDRPYPEAVADVPSFFLSGTLAANSSDAGNRLYATVAQAMQPLVEELNPLLGPSVIATAADCQDATFLAQFSLVVASRLNIREAVRISQVTAANGGKFYMVDTFGMFGACVLDLGPDHEYRPEVGKTLLDPTKLATYVPLETIFNVPLQDAVNRFHKTVPDAWLRYRCLLEYVARSKNVWPSRETADDFVQVIQSWVAGTVLADHELIQNAQALRELASIATCEIAPVCSVLGGIVGNEIIKAISGKGEPANNTVLFDGLTCKAMTFLVQRKN
jgi:ubiquitin-like 1-activating enzyme E1 A